MIEKRVTQLSNLSLEKCGQIDPRGAILGPLLSVICVNKLYMRWFIL